MIGDMEGGKGSKGMSRRKGISNMWFVGPRNEEEKENKTGVDSRL